MVGEADLRHFAVVGRARKVAFGRAIHDDMENDVCVVGVDGVVVLLPTGCREVDFDCAAVFVSIQSHRGADKVRAGFAVPFPEVNDGGLCSGGRGKGASAGPGKPAGLPGKFVPGGWRVLRHASRAGVECLFVGVAQEGVHRFAGRWGADWSNRVPPGRDGSSRRANTMGLGLFRHGFFGVGDGGGGGGAIS